MEKILYSLKSLNKFLEEEKPSNICLVTSQKLLNKFSWAIREMSISKSSVIFLPDGETAKQWKEIEKLIKSFIKLGLDRKSIVIALGGGSIGDSAGFASAIYLRGIRIIQVPTTLLAQVDSAHGGKTGINFLNYKNQVGVIHLPIAVVIDLRFLKSLGREQVTDGLGEIIKAGFIKDPSILTLLKKETISAILKSHRLKTIINKAIKVKQYYINRDLNDKNIRQVLNFGHTVAHSLELKYKLSHGKAVLIGMIEELKIAEKLRRTKPEIRMFLKKIIAGLGIKLEQLKLSKKSIFHDKKIVKDEIYLPIIKKIGEVKLIKIKVSELFS